MTAEGPLSPRIEEALWPVSRLGEAIDGLHRHGRLSPSGATLENPPDAVLAEGGAALRGWIDAAARWVGLEAEPVDAPHGEVSELLLRAAPALVFVGPTRPPRFVVLAGRSGKRLRLLGPDLIAHDVEVEELRQALCADAEAPLSQEIETLLDRAEVPANRRARASRGLIEKRLAGARIGGCWILRQPPGSSPRRQAVAARLHLGVLATVCAHAVQYLLYVLAWWVLGSAALGGRLEPGWFWAWALLLAALVPTRLLFTWTSVVTAIRTGGLLRQRLLAGALRLQPEETRHQGVGQLLSRVIESEAVESLAIGGGLMSAMAFLELLVATAILLLVGPGRPAALILVLWTALTSALAWRYLQRRREWTRERLRITHDLVERMVGHRTRLAQEPPERWHEEEDRFLERYLLHSHRMDRAHATLSALVPRGFLFLGIASLGASLVAAPPESASVAAALGGILLAYQALRRLTEGLSQLAGAAISWEQVAPLFHAAARPEVLAPPSLHLAPDGKAHGPLLEARDVTFRHESRPESVLSGASLAVAPGERILLQGPSGSGKSTLASLLSGLRRPGSGLLILHGLDHQTLGLDGWRRHIGCAPQFHENHVLSASFGFNLLMGRAWPPRSEDMQAARALCHELGLGDVLRRMPAGLEQMLGETGWQLSHGERSRLYLARALLQETDLVILDESFAALDPETLRQALGCAVRRAPSLLVIAHP